MKQPIVYCFAFLLVFTGCKKVVHEIDTGGLLSSSTINSGFTKYTIKAGQHSADLNYYKVVDVSELKFIVRFDSSAIYNSGLKENQYDINKLYGFSDNKANHHQFSARIGWRWSDNALRLFAYVYNDAAVISKELGIVSIGADINCSIKITGSQYLFSVNKYYEVLPRASKTSSGKGYQLYPYFGGDETAPHDVNIWIKNL